MAKPMKIDIGISAKDREVIADGLSHLLADSYTLYLQSHNFHWNVTGPMFQTLHVLFMEHYTEQWNALDLIAERIRSLGLPAPGTYKEFVKLASIKEVEGTPGAKEMIRILVARPGSRGENGARRVHGRRGRQRSADLRSLDAAHAGPRKERLDAAQLARGRRQGLIRRTFSRPQPAL